jgi:GAF domain-containing protein
MRPAPSKELHERFIGQRGFSVVLDAMINRLKGEKTFDEALHRVLVDAMALNGAEFGTLQLLDGDTLLIVDQQSFKPPFLNTFRAVVREEGSACGRALRSGKTVVIEDIEKDAEFAPFREVAKEAGYRSVVTTPLTTAGKKPLGIVATHFARVHSPTKVEIETFEKYCVFAADYLMSLLHDAPIATKALLMNQRLYGHAERVL